MDIKKIDWVCTKCGEAYFGDDCHICPYCKHDDRLAYMESLFMVKDGLKKVSK